jgi:hypothetical protein
MRTDETLTMRPSPSMVSDAFIEHE